MPSLRLCFILAVLLAAPLHAQVDARPPADTAAATAAPALPAGCTTGPVSAVFVDNHSIFDMNDPGLARRLRWAYEGANRLHVRTRKSVIQRELLLGIGDCYDPARVEESARILRGYSFISSADVFGVAQPDGSFHVVTDTQDEWTTQIDMRVGFTDGVDFQGGRIRESNVLGTGQSVELYYLRRDVTRDYGFGYETPQFLGTRWDMSLVSGRSRAGTTVGQMLAYPFLGETGRWAARQSFDHEDRLFDYIAGDASGQRTHILLPVHDRAFDLAFVSRLGQRGNLTLFGTGLSLQRRSYVDRVEVVRGRDYSTRTPADSATMERIADQLDRVHSLRVALLLGQRNIWWTKRRGFDSLRGQQDIRLGVEGGLSLAAALPMVSDDDDFFGTFTLYAGVEAGPAIVAARARIDARRDLHAPTTRSEWEDVYGEGELLAYLRPGFLPRHTLLLRGAGAAGWNTVTPFQLTLGGDRGLRGYHPERLPGGRRAVVTLEDRFYFGWPFRDLFDLGSSTFVDVGRMWPGDVPYGSDSGWRASGGVGLRMSFPAGSRNTYRIDLAVPLDKPIRAQDARLIISIGEFLGLTARFGDNQVFRSRQPGVSGELFNFPN